MRRTKFDKDGRLIIPNGTTSRQCCFAHEGNRYNNKSLKPLPGKGETESRSNFENLQVLLFIEAYITNLFCKNVTKIATS
jgi:hypothetical protein